MDYCIEPRATHNRKQNGSDAPMLYKYTLKNIYKDFLSNLMDSSCNLNTEVESFPGAQVGKKYFTANV